MDYYRRFPGDYIAETLHLTMIEDCVYTRLLDYQYRAERHIEGHAEAINIARAKTPEEVAAVAKIFERYFPGGINKRFKAELNYTIQKRNKCKKASALGHKVRWGLGPRTVPDGMPDGMAQIDRYTDRQIDESQSLLSRKKRAPKQSSTITKDFILSEEMKAYATSRQLDPKTTLEEFIDYHLQRGKPSKDWAASWRTWCRNAVKFKEKDANRQTAFRDKRLHILEENRREKERNLADTR